MFRKKRLFVIICSGIIAFVCTWSSASPQLLTAVASDIKMYLDSNIFEPKEADGTPLALVIINNRTYLPIRALCEKIGLNVNWVEQTKSIELISQKQKAQDYGPDNILEGSDTDLVMLKPGKNNIKPWTIAKIRVDNTAPPFEWIYEISAPDIIEFSYENIFEKKLEETIPNGVTPTLVPGSRYKETLWNFKPLKEGDCKIILKSSLPSFAKEEIVYDIHISK